jgi:acetyltransferase-like isoleucine patch superfamily enzyme
MIIAWQIFYGLDRMKYLVTIIYYLKIDKVLMILLGAIAQAKAKRYGKLSQQKIKFVPQGGFDFEIMGNIKKFKIHETSHLKSGTYIECSGGVDIGSYFHSGRGLIIFSSVHNWKDGEAIPYDNKIITERVTIRNFVWCGANVTILPGSEVGEGAIIGAGTVVTKSVPDLAIYAGNPGKIIGFRDKAHFERLKKLGKFY